MARVWGLLAGLLCLFAYASAQSQPSSTYSNCKFGYQVNLPAGISRSDLGDSGFEIDAGHADAAGNSAVDKLRVVATKDAGLYTLWQQNGRLLGTYRVDADHGRPRFAQDWERAGGLLLLEWHADQVGPSDHMAHARPRTSPQLKYAVLRREDDGTRIVYTFTLTGAAAATPWTRSRILRAVLSGFQPLPLDRGACTTNLALR
jgi:hypothetical protein